MNKFFGRNYLRLAIPVAVTLPTTILTSPIVAKPIKDCPPVIRSLKTEQLYCAHELNLLKQQRAGEESEASFLCLFTRTIIPPNDVIKANQCFPQANFSNETGRKILPTPKGPKPVLSLLTPAGSIQLTTQPVLEWKPIANASYQVILESGGKWVWSEETKNTKLQLPLAHALQHGSFYKLSVIAFREDQAIAEDSTKLQLADPGQIKALDDALLKAQQVSRNPLPRGLDRAMMLYHMGLFDAAISELQSLTQYQDPTVYSQLGLIYSEAGDKQIAQSYLDKASELANRKVKPLSKAN